MAKYFLIESRSPFDSPEVINNYQLASDLAEAGNEVTLFFVENGVLVARNRSEVQSVANLNSVKLLADDFSLRERGIDKSELGDKVQTSSIGSVIDAMSDGQKMIWL